MNDHVKETTYYVNGEPYDAMRHKMTVREILEIAGLTPAEDYRLIRENGNKEFTDYNEEVPISKNESFMALYKGVTPTSWR